MRAHLGDAVSIKVDVAAADSGQGETIKLWIDCKRVDPLALSGDDAARVARALASYLDQDEKRALAAERDDLRGRIGRALAALEDEADQPR